MRRSFFLLLGALLICQYLTAQKATAVKAAEKTIVNTVKGSGRKGMSSNIKNTTKKMVGKNVRIGVKMPNTLSSVEVKDLLLQIEKRNSGIKLSDNNVIGLHSLCIKNGKTSIDDLYSLARELNKYSEECYSYMRELESYERKEITKEQMSELRELRKRFPKHGKQMEFPDLPKSHFNPKFEGNISFQQSFHTDLRHTSYSLLGKKTIFDDTFFQRLGSEIEIIRKQPERYYLLDDKKGKTYVKHFNSPIGYERVTKKMDGHFVTEKKAIYDLKIGLNDKGEVIYGPYPLKEFNMKVYLKDPAVRERYQKIKSLSE